MMPLTVDGWRCSLFHSFFLFSLFPTHKEGKQARIVTVKFEGSERTNSTHTVHTYLYALTCCCCHGTPHTQTSPRDRIRRKEEGRKRE
ncbi:putative trans-sialidase [Trypanosoma cruzi Dm28c]|uniref:Putative trans-sialidase n=1 Tax=Trypanosoma cruzi Dm28c TaxID=1416333 RepID=V5AJH6_TRYCR|nr:putative trans-sialidase [Trypanosoma cruzi Dm28c]